MIEFEPHSIYHLSVGEIELDCLSKAGPRIIGLSYKGSGNLLATVPQIATSTPFGDYHYIGGHRLWHAPEAMPRSYIPDDDGVTLTELENGILLDGKTELATHIHKQIIIQINPQYPEIKIKHTLINEGLWDIELAPWAITMFRHGGVAILPMHHPISQDNLLPNRHIALWSYTHIKDPRLTLTDEFIFVKPMPEQGPFKIGTFNLSGWIGYWIDGILFRKRFDVYPDQPHPDHNSNAEIYCDEYFIELESIAPLTKLKPGESIAHIEAWEFFEQLEQPFLSPEIIPIIQALR
ncbi:MAG: hypothetical protein ACPL0B_02470 [Anaerolineales bacterium]